MIAFDECSILHMYKFKVPEAYVKIYGEEITFKNHKQLTILMGKIKKPYRFVPGLGNNVHKAIFELIGGQTSMMANVFAKEIKNGLQDFLKGLKEWEEISRNKDCEDVQTIFEDNKQPLKKEPKIPEKEDCEIIAGYRDYEGTNKILISEDEHFWGYKRLI